MAAENVIFLQVLFFLITCWNRLEDFPLNSVTLYDNDAERQAVIGEALEILMKEELKSA